MTDKMKPGKQVLATQMPDINQFVTPSMLGEAVTAARTQRGQRIIDAAKDIGVNKTTLSKVEKGDTSVSSGNLFKVAEYYGIGLVIVDMGSHTFDIASPKAMGKEDKDNEKWF